MKAVNYVLKPISKDKMFAIFDELLEQINEKQNEEAIIVKSGEGIRKILIPNLVCAEVIGRNVMYHLASGKVIRCTEPFSGVCDKLQRFGCFVGTHRAYLVNMQHIGTIENHRATLQTLPSVPLAQGKTREIKEKYLADQMEAE